VLPSFGLFWAYLKRFHRFKYHLPSYAKTMVTLPIVPPSDFLPLNSTSCSTQSSLAPPLSQSLGPLTDSNMKVVR
jgi:hypothetical protein